MTTDDFPTTADVVIVGGGVHGASLAYHLARKKAGRVVLFEKQFLASGPTGRSTALVRQWSGLDFLTRLGTRSLATFQNWAAIIGGDCGFRPIGFLALSGDSGGSALRQTVDRARGLGAKVDLIGPEALREIVPETATDDIVLAAYESESGYVDPSLTTSILAARGRELGAIIALRTVVTDIVTIGGKVTGVRTTRGEISAPTVVICAGVWANRLLAPLGIEVPLAPTRHQVCFFVRPVGFIGHPAIADLTNDSYARPDAGNLTIFGLLTYTEIVDPDNYDEGVDRSEIAGNAERIARRFPIMRDGLSRGGYAGVYDNTPDHEPVLGAIPEYTGLFANFGWSGHGFKHAPAIGDILSDVILFGHAAGYDLQPFRWSRFRDGDLIARQGIL